MNAAHAMNTVHAMNAAHWRNSAIEIFMKPAAAVALICSLAAWTPSASAADSVREIQCDLLIVGATESGWAAAIQAARMGIESITLVHDGKWIGGQFTEQALACVDENKGVGKVGWGVDWHPMKRSFHRSGLFKELMDRIESMNQQRYGSPMPGRPYHGPSTFRPADAESVFRDMLEPWVNKGQLRLIFDHYPVAATVEGKRLTGVSFAPLDSNIATIRVTAGVTIDASDWGDVIQLSGAAFECGVDPKSRYAEPSAPADLENHPPTEMNPITWAMILEDTGADWPIARPQRFDDRNFVRSSRISLNAMKDLAWDRPVRLSSILHWPAKDNESPRQLSIYTVRRLVDGRASKRGQTVILMNYMLGQDYPLERLPRHVVDALEQSETGASQKNIVEMSRQQRRIVFEDAKRHSLSLLYHLQNFVHERASDKANSFRQFRLSDEFETEDRLPPKPYIRESLRLKAMYMMREQDSRNADGPTKASARDRFARVMYHDSVACWQFHFDFHRTGRAYLQHEGNAGPWVDFEKPGRHTRHISDRSVFPMRSLIPVEVDGLIGAQKNLGYSSIVCAAIRLHDQCIAIGQAAGATAAIAIEQEVDPRRIPYDRSRLELVREGLCNEKHVPLLLWPYRDLAPEHEAFVAVNRLAAIGVVVDGPYQVDFKPDVQASQQWRERMIALAEKATTERIGAVPITRVTRGEFCRELWNRVESVSLSPFSIPGDGDSDGDGIADGDDPTPLSAGPPVVWSIRPPGDTEDGVPDATEPPPGSIRFNFCPAGSQPIAGFINDTGLQFDAQRGYGWAKDITDQSRRRNRFHGEPRDTFLFTRDKATWHCDLENGNWQITLCVGDAAHAQSGQRISIGSVEVVDDAVTAAGRFLEVTENVDIREGGLTMTLGPQAPDHNTCVNWIELIKRK